MYIDHWGTGGRCWFHPTSKSWCFFLAKLWEALHLSTSVAAQRAIRSSSLVSLRYLLDGHSSKLHQDMFQQASRNKETPSIWKKRMMNDVSSRSHPSGPHIIYYITILSRIQFSGSGFPFLRYRNSLKLSWRYRCRLRKSSSALPGDHRTSSRHKGWRRLKSQEILM